MSIDTTNRQTSSAYPAPIEALLPRARKLLADLGEVPSRNKLMGEFKIGAPKAGTLRQALIEEAEQTERAEQDRTEKERFAEQYWLQQVRRGSLMTREEAGLPALPVENSEQVEADPVPSRLTLVTTETAPAVSTEDTAETLPLVSVDGHPGTPVDSTGEEVPPPVRRAAPRSWPVLLLALPAFVAIWSGWVGLGGLTGFGIVHPLPGIADGFSINTAITLPIGVEAYAAYALHAWLSPGAPARARRFARWSALASLAVGALGQVAYHLMASLGITEAPWQITTLVACLPVAVLGMGAALAHLLHDTSDQH